MVKCDGLTVPQLKKMCQIKQAQGSLPEYSKERYGGYSRMAKDALIPKCCGDPDLWVNPILTRQLPGTIRRRLTRPRGKLTGMQFVEWLRENLEHDKMVRTSGWAGGEMTGWTAASGSTGYSVCRRPFCLTTAFKTHQEGDIDVHIVLSGKEVGLRYTEWTEWDEDEGEKTLHRPLNPDRVHPRIRKTLERMGLDVKEIASTGNQLYWDDDVSYDIRIQRPDYLLDR